MLPDDYIRKMKQDLSEVEAQVESKTRYEPDPDSSPPPDDDWPPGSRSFTTKTPRHKGVRSDVGLNAPASALIPTLSL